MTFNHQIIRSLFVEDSFLDYQLMDSAVRKLNASDYGFYLDVDWARNFDEGLSKAKKGRYDIFFIDYVLNGNTGLDFAGSLANEGASGPFIIMTGYDNLSFVNEALNSGAYDYILKNELTPSLLFRCISYALERKKVEERLKQDDHRGKLEALGQMASGIAHELNNLLQPIMLKADDICDETNNDGVKKKAEIIIDCARSAASVIDDILSFSHIKNKGVDCVDIRKTALKQIGFAREILPKSITFSLSGFEGSGKKLGCDVCYSQISADDLFRVFCNLFLNAAQAMDYTGQIDIEFRHIASEQAMAMKGYTVKPKESAQGYAQIRVKDTGPGISLETLPKIFAPFFTTKEVQSGTGLGLSIVQNVIQGWGGTIKAANDSEGSGAVFSMLIPCMRP